MSRHHHRATSGGGRPSRRARLSRRQRKRLRLGILFGVLTTFLALAVGWWYGEGCPDLYHNGSSAVSESSSDVSTPISSEDAPFQVVFLDVGQGDSQLILCDGYTMLIDAGEHESASTVLNGLYRRGITTLDYLVLTHPHSDHMGGAREVLKNMTVKNLLMPDAVTNTSTYEKTLDAIEKAGLSVTVPAVGDTFSLGGATCQVLSPQDHEYEDGLNDHSLVLMVEYAGRKVLFTGDTGPVPQKEMMAAFDLTCDVYKVAHHGSYYNNQQDWLAALSPAYAVISCDGVSYEHPHEGTLRNLNDAGVTCYRTDRSGQVTLLVSSTGEMAFETEK